MKALIEAIKEKLEKRGFEVILNDTLEGISGIQHRFDLLARKEEIVICVDIPNPSFMLPAVYGKAIDLPWVKVLVPVKEENPCSYDHTIDNLSMISYKDVEDLTRKFERKLKEFLYG
ncbi:MAG: hypothetical protein DRN00_04425 [Thermoplasmata archaeon]|nr:MAG: hypothetical protein DRN00_04425 [Thermoplasmata archaeon]